MEISREIYFIFFGILSTFFVDLCLSSTSYRLLFLTLIRIVALFIAFFYRIICDNDEKDRRNGTKNFFGPDLRIFSRSLQLLSKHM